MQQDLVQLVLTNMDQLYSQLGHRSQAGGLLERFKNQLLSEEEKRAFNAKLELRILVPLHFILLHTEILGGLTYLKQNTRAGKKKAIPEPTQPEQKAPTTIEIPARAINRDPSAANRFGPEQLTRNVEFKRGLAADPGWFRSPSWDADSVDGIFSFSYYKNELKHGQTEILFDLDDNYRLESVELCPAPDPLLPAPQVQVLASCASPWIAEAFQTVLPTTQVAPDGPTTLSVHMDALPLSRYVKLVLSGPQTTGLYYVAFRATPLIAKTMKIDLHAVSPIVILPGVTVAGSGADAISTVECVVLSPGQILVDNRGTFEEKHTTYRTQQATFNPRRERTVQATKRYFTISIKTEVEVNDKTSSFPVMYLERYCWRMSREQILEVLDKIEEGDASADTTDRRVIYLDAGNRHCASVEACIRFVSEEQRSDLETLMLPYGSCVVLRLQRDKFDAFQKIIKSRIESVGQQGAPSNGAPRAMPRQSLVPRASTLEFLDVRARIKSHISSAFENPTAGKILFFNIMHNIRFVYIDQFTAAVNAQGPIHISKHEDVLTVDVPELVGRAPDRTALSMGAEESDHSLCKEMMLIAVKAFRAAEQEEGGFAQETKDRIKSTLWTDLRVHTTSSPSAARALACFLSDQIKVIEEDEDRNPQDQEIFGDDLDKLKQELLVAEFNSCDIRVRAGQPIGESSIACLLTYNWDGKRGVKVNLPTLRCNTAMVGQVPI